MSLTMRKTYWLKFDCRVCGPLVWSILSIFRVSLVWLFRTLVPLKLVTMRVCLYILFKICGGKCTICFCFWFFLYMMQVNRSHLYWRHVSNQFFCGINLPADSFVVGEIFSVKVQIIFPRVWLLTFGSDLLLICFNFHFSDRFEKLILI